MLARKGYIAHAEVAAARASDDDRLFRGQAEQLDAIAVVSGEDRFSAPLVGQIRGEVTPEHNVLSGPVVTAPPLANEIERIPAGERYSYLYRGTHQVFDHALTSRAAQPYVTGQQYGRGNADSPGFLITDDSVAVAPRV